MKKSARDVLLAIDDHALASMEDASALLAVVGLPALMKKGSLRLTDPVRKRAATLPIEISKRMLAFLQEPKFKPIALDLPQIDLPTLREEFARQVDAAWLAEKLSQVSEEDKFSFGSMVTTAYSFLLSKIPPLPTTFRPTKPSDFVSASFMRAYRTVSDPMTVVADLEMGCLSIDQVKTLVAVYPNIHEMFKTALLSAATEVMQDPDYVIPYKKLKMVAILNLQPMVGSSLQEVLQADFQQQEQPAPPSGGAAAKPTENLTQTQKIELERP
jgi:hypothetical protein